MLKLYVLNETKFLGIISLYSLAALYYKQQWVISKGERDKILEGSDWPIEIIRKKNICLKIKKTFLILNIKMYVL